MTYRKIAVALLLLSPISLVPPVLAQGCISIAAGRSVPDLPASADSMVLFTGVVESPIPQSTPVAGTWTITAQQVDTINGIVGPLTPAEKKLATIRPSRNGNALAGPVLKLAIPPATCAAEADDEPAPAGTAKAATPEDCFKEAVAWSLGNGRYRQPVLFNSKGSYCYSPPILRAGDMLVVGMVTMPGESAPEASAEITGCTREDSTPKFPPTDKLPDDIGKQSTRPATVRFLTARPCGNDAPVVNVEVEAGGKKVNSSHTLSQFPRYQATFHLGAVYTDLHQPEFALRDEDGTQIVYNKEAENRGPEYVVTVVVQGFFRYFRYFDKERNAQKTFSPTESRDLPIWKGENNPDKWPYKGRDPIHDDATRDRLGLVLSAGLKNPGDRFGVGLSYEISRGINIVALYEMARLKELNGLSPGDPYAGALEDLPVGRKWESKASLGMTFDLAYVTKLFTR